MLGVQAVDSRIDDVHLWLADLDAAVCEAIEFWESLSTDEQTRAAGIRSAVGRRRYVAAHGLLRAILAEQLDVQPRELHFCCEANGKPYLHELAEQWPVQFNLSHSEHLLLIGESRDKRVGVDIERVTADIEWRKLAKRFYSAEENDQLHALHPDLTPTAFFRIWTAKEAFLKATGRGITISLASIETELLHCGREVKLVRVAGDAVEASHWDIRAVETRPGFVATIACESSASRAAM